MKKSHEQIEKRKIRADEAAKNGLCRGCLVSPICKRSKSYCERCLNLRNKANRKYNESHKKENATRTLNWVRRNLDKKREQVNRHRATHKDHYAKTSKAYKQTEKYKKKSAEYREKNKERNREISSEWQRKNPERRKKNVAKWLSENPGKTAEYSHRYRKKHPDQILKTAKERRARLNAMDGSFCAEEWIELCNKFGNKCLWCEKIGGKLTVDHVVPISKGGSGFISNIQPLCPNCNSRKNNKILDFRPFGAAILDWT